MDNSFASRFRKAWNVFFNKDPTPYRYTDGPGSSYPPGHLRLGYAGDKSLATAIYNRIALDASSIDVRHVRNDEDGRFVEVVGDKLNFCLTREANLDQTGRAFIQDAVHSMLDEGCIAIVPVETTCDPMLSESWDVLNLRVGKITQWFPQRVEVSVYNERTGLHEQIILPKRQVAIIQNPFYSVMNEPNSTLQRLIRKLNLLDIVDEQSSSGKLDLIIQLPYVIKTDARRQQAETRRKDIEEQLSGSKYGIAYTDGTEHITQLNRSVENNLLGQVQYLTSMLYSQLGITQAIMDGTADEATMLNYYTRTIEPILAAITDEMTRKFLSRTARTQRQTVSFFRDPFVLMPISQIAETADRMTRNEIMSSNEIRQIIGLKPSSDPNADMLRNKNLYARYGDNNIGSKAPVAGSGPPNNPEENQNEV